MKIYFINRKRKVRKPYEKKTEEKERGREGGGGTEGGRGRGGMEGERGRWREREGERGNRKRGRFCVRVVNGSVKKRDRGETREIDR